MVQPLTTLPETASQTAGPYVHIGCTPNFVGIHGIYPADLGSGPAYPDLTDRVRIVGRIIDGTGAVIRDCMVESWQAGPDGEFRTEGFCRAAADPDTGEWTLDTVMPGRVPLPNGRLQAPHVALWITARGINIGLHTRIYFAGHATDDDPLLARVELRKRVETLIARRDGDVWRHDVVLQGENETVFLDM
jgi:protocatechuate 3,4-dioxygenase, alpha subunit